MKRKSLGMILVTLLFLVFGCSKDEKVESKLTLPEDIPSFVEATDFEQVDWNKKAVKFNNDIIGNENKSGVIGADMPSVKTPQKWMWHLWGTNLDSAKLTVVGLHKKTNSISQILTDGWTIELGEGNNGADAHSPSNVQFPKPGEWAILLYTNEKLFDILVLEINE